MKNFRLVQYFVGIISLFVIATSCKKDPKESGNDEELITTLKLTFVPIGGGPTLTYQFKDADGEGGVAPVQDDIILAPSKSYDVTIQLLNESVNPAEDVTEEVQTEARAHRFYFEPSAGSNIVVSNLNNDPDGVPLGIVSKWETSANATGTIAVILRHYAGNPPGKAIDDPVNSSKSTTDIEVTFVVKVQ